jgi:transcriptional regulator with XRE-family HTH domain
MVINTRKEFTQMSINERIKQLRQTLNLSQAKFAKAISISNGYIAGIELGKRNVNDRIIKLICITFNVNEQWLKAGEGDMFKRQPNQLSTLASSLFEELKPEYQEYILKQIDQLLDIQHNEKSK